MVVRLMRRAFAQRLEGGVLTFAQSRALVHLVRREGVRQIKLAKLLEVQPITRARLLDQLNALGLVERRADPRDRCASPLSHVGCRAAPPGDPPGVGDRAPRCARIDADQAASVLRTLGRMRRNLAAVDLATGNSRRPSA